MERTLQDIIEDLQEIDFGYLEGADVDARERLLRRLEDIVDELQLDLGLEFPEADAAIRHFLTEPALARTYIYGPTDMGTGEGLLEQLKELALNDPY